MFSVFVPIIAALMAGSVGTNAAMYNQLKDNNPGYPKVKVKKEKTLPGNDKAPVKKPPKRVRPSEKPAPLVPKDMRVWNRAMNKISGIRGIVPPPGNQVFYKNSKRGRYQGVAFKPRRKRRRYRRRR